jgi:hypothetical protein
MNLQGRMAWTVVDALWSSKLVRLSRATASLLGLDPATAGEVGAVPRFNPDKISEIVHSKKRRNSRNVRHQHADDVVLWHQEIL